ncbi:MAG: diadenylate cyclase CdaA [Spirochaetales bacterium]|uniref:Diadenylate cyclase n=1 Tax=Candidatus Thalassospirochaeta sargassi TaxID=3119039 RepID=A0AAJ1IJS7_9SPIO|nr:diadenylate cyclase CdaA [Spirochaetales bacterium]
MSKLNEFWVFNDVIRPFLDIAILSFLIYQMYKILIQTRALQLLRGAVIIVAIYAGAYLLELDTLRWIMNGLATVIVIVLAVVFQPELRSIFTRIGQRDWFKSSSGAKPRQIESVLNAVDVLAGRRRGALIVFSRKMGLKNIQDTGTLLDAELSSSLILTMFSYDTPLHDGAVIIHGGRINSAGCFLPLSEQTDIRRSFGTRHRAALGLAEETDAVILIVSEETGAISLAYDANLFYDLSIEEARRKLKYLLNSREDVIVEEENNFA